jgi:hypothetical protein
MASRKCAELYVKCTRCGNVTSATVGECDADTLNADHIEEYGHVFVGEVKMRTVLYRARELPTRLFPMFRRKAA